MKYRSIYTVLFMAFLVNVTYGQKIKYKDLFPILEAKNYEEGKPQLLAYLSALKKDEANPNLQMGLMIEDSFLKLDIINDSSRIYSSGDSSIFFLEKAKSLIDEKELKKRDEYYQSFFRRDLRTGEFGIKVSDVHLDIEKKMEAIEQRMADVKLLNQSLNRVNANYERVQNKFKTLVEKFDAYNTLLLAATTDDQSELASIQSMAADVVSDAQAIQEIAQRLGSDKFQQEVSLNSIEVFGEDGFSTTDIRSGTISFWDYETWCREALSEIRGGVALFKTLITNYSNEIRKKKSRLKKGQEADGLEVPNEIFESFDRYDANSVVRTLLNVETFEARVIKNVDLQLNPDLMDSSKIGSQLAIYSLAKANADTLYDLVQSIEMDELAGAKIRYPDYINSFFTSHGTVSKYVQEMKKWSARNKDWITNSVAFWTERNRWGTIAKEGEAERILALFEADSLYGGFKILRVNKFTIPQVVVVGIDSTTQKGYIGSFGEDRVEQWALDFEIPESEGYVYTLDTIPATKDATSFYLYNADLQENNLAMVSYSDTGTKQWSVMVTLTKEPVDFKFDDLTQELTVLMYPEEELPLDSDDLGYIVIDRTGNVR